MRAPSSRQLVIALVISVAVNCFLGGFLVSRWLDRRHRPPPGARAGGGDRIEQGLFQARRVLGKEAHPAIDRVYAHHHERLRGSMREHRAARRAVHQALVAEPFDADKLRQALATLRERTGSSQEQLHEALVELASQLSLEQREKLARAHRRGLRGPPR